VAPTAAPTPAASTAAPTPAAPTAAPKPAAPTAAPRPAAPTAAPSKTRVEDPTSDAVSINLASSTFLVGVVLLLII
jgi:hypothetical protein